MSNHYNIRIFTYVTPYLRKAKVLRNVIFISFMQCLDFCMETTICLWIKISTSLFILAYLPLNIIYTHNGTYEICQNITIKPTQTSVLKLFYCKWKWYFSVHFPELHLHSNANSLYVYIQTWFLLFWCCQY